MGGKGAPLGLGIFQNAELVVLAILRVAAQGVRSHQVVCQMQIDMRPRAEGREVDTLTMRQRQQDHLALQLPPDNL
ncbi:hypothetical protein D3C76_1620340 [compost metagenome]